jgi:hypothetical protein
MPGDDQDAPRTFRRAGEVLAEADRLEHHDHTQRHSGQTCRLYDPAAAIPVDMAKGEPQTVMPWASYAGMRDVDLGAIDGYLSTVAPVANIVERWTIPAGP